MKEALYEFTSLRTFAGLDLDVLPDETTILNFRHMLEQSDLVRTSSSRSMRTWPELWSAIGMERLGDFDHDVRDKRNHRFLVMLAEAGNVRAQEILMIDFLEGLNGSKKDVEWFLYWSGRAAEAGSKTAETERRKFERRSRK